MVLQIVYKYECYKNIPISYIRWLCEDIYSIEELNNTEWVILETLEYKLKWPGPMFWLCQFEDIKDSNILILSQYLIELTLLDEKFLEWPTSYIIVARFCLTLYLYQNNWINYTIENLASLIDCLFDILQDDHKNSAIYNKLKTWLKPLPDTSPHIWL
ncbi:hypothetical protein BC936DRAFT_142001 [Jimgerdemannia flammicorona]|uniref:Cyclin C-terminal domain-containing protein n=1 Tax=Jimgerdemannia flammicorona TaxID=994334 RepID=A0A433A1B8_9FUNG|nr:hypothetical protein BC936DRAFT_142001 [Jimgerdemannia flammicorona]